MVKSKVVHAFKLSLHEDVWEGSGYKALFSLFC
jgi:hypothetical protein